MREVQDHYFYLAKKEKFLARSVYKLKEINEKFNLIKKGHKVLDLGCSPGSWMQFAAKIVGPEGDVLGLDIKKIIHSFPANVTVRMENVYDQTEETLGGRRYNVVLSDMAPSTSGIKSSDALLSATLCEEVLRIASLCLKNHGGLIMKNFESGETPVLLKATAQMFETAKIYKPLASRAESREIFIVGKGKKPNPVDTSTETKELKTEIVK